MANFSQFSRYKNGIATANDNDDLFIINRGRIVLPESEEDTFFSNRRATCEKTRLNS